MDVDPTTLAGQAAGDSVTPERLVPAVLNALAEGEQPHYLLQAQSLDRAEPPENSPDRTFPAVDAAVSVVATDRRVLFVVPKPVADDIESVTYDEIEAVTAETGQFKEFEVRTATAAVAANLAADEDPEPATAFVDRQATSDGTTAGVGGAAPERQGSAQSESDSSAEAGVDSGAESEAGQGDADTGSGTVDSRGDDAGSDGTSAVDPLDRIERLADLRDRGIITDDEFEERKSELLDRL